MRSGTFTIDDGSTDMVIEKEAFRRDVEAAHSSSVLTRVEGTRATAIDDGSTDNMVIEKETFRRDVKAAHSSLKGSTSATSSGKAQQQVQVGAQAMSGSSNRSNSSAKRLGERKTKRLEEEEEDICNTTDGGVDWVESSVPTTTTGTGCHHPGVRDVVFPQLSGEELDRLAVPAPRRSQQSNARAMQPGAYPVERMPRMQQRVPVQEQEHQQDVRSVAPWDITGRPSEHFSTPMPESNGDDLAVANLIEGHSQFLAALPQAEEFDQLADQERKKEKQEKRSKTYAFLGCILLLVIVGILVAVLVPSTRETSAAVETTATAPSTIQSSPTTSPSAAPSLSLEETIKALFEQDTLHALQDPESPQSRAFEWLLEDAQNIPSYTTDHRIKQKFALATLYYATNGHNWVRNDKWLNHSVNECLWYMAPDFAMKSIMGTVYPGYLSEFFPDQTQPPKTCNSQGIYQNLWLDRNSLAGYLPEELYMMTSLQTISMGFNHLEGSLSSRLGKLTQLEGLVIFNPPSEGNIPSELGLLSNTLRGIGLAGSNHQGPIPSELWQLTKLETFALMDHPHMQGTIPSEIGLFADLKWIILDYNDFSGTIPTELGQLEKLQWVVLKHSRITGTIPSSLARINNKLTINLSSNNLVGTLPSELGLLTKLSFDIQVENNRLTGTIPSELGLLTNLGTVLDLHTNLFTGTIPTELGQLSGAHELYFQNSQLTGPIPSEFGLLTRLGQLKLANNSLSSTIPQELSDLQPSLHTITLNANPMLTGTVPDAICRINGTCVVIPMLTDPSCSGPFGAFFDCGADGLCGCDCPC
ncbi:Leucine Rich Repeat [Seminavis robusta]|uniref:Leucine Rich Repeat n=1 Tax=Seminavis robusta TaxID=568900 RepID=A0A9N8F3E3_9STRA|nr:Leucine Rich Repeat [Seminavis robusta]|eukprot:Sro2695_g334880.1 Leucine Rich Repeat (812) ;mRNA; f:6705-9291